MDKWLILAGLTGLGVAGYMMMKREAQGSAPKPPSTGTITFDCSKGQLLEAHKIYTNSGGKSYCAGLSPTHTYKFSRPIHITEIKGSVLGGPRGNTTTLMTVELSPDGRSWYTVGSIVASNDSYTPFDIKVRFKQKFMYLRFRAGIGYKGGVVVSKQDYVDGSKGVVYYD